MPAAHVSALVPILPGFRLNISGASWVMPEMKLPEYSTGSVIPQGQRVTAVRINACKVQQGRHHREQHAYTQEKGWRRNKALRAPDVQVTMEALSGIR
jgi:hypothetical protein